MQDNRTLWLNTVRTASLMLALFVSVVLGSHAEAQIPCRYEYVTWPNMDCGFGPYPGGPVAVNMHGHVAGRWASCGEPLEHTFIWTGGPTTTILPIPPGYRRMQPADMNDLGEIVGMLELPMGTPNPLRAFIRRVNGQVIDLGLPPGAPVNSSAQAYAINNNSEVTGFVYYPGFDYRPFIWKDGVFTLIEMPPGYSWTSEDIDDAGRLAVYPWHAEGGRWHKGNLTLLGLLPGGTFSQPLSLAPNLNVCGRANTDQTPTGELLRRAFLYKGGQIYNLGLLPNTIDSHGTGITNTLVVGYCASDPGATFWFGNGVMRRLDSMQPNPNLILFNSPRISSNGLIAVTGRIGVNGPHVGVVLTPVYAPIGDVNNDCRVNVNDLLGVINSWGSCPNAPACPADINGDGIVNKFDLLLVIENWGQQS